MVKLIWVMALVLGGTLLAQAELLMVSDQQRPLPQPAYRADDFVDSIALNASPYEGNHTDGPFAGAGTFYPPEMFLELGVRYYRQALLSSLTKADTPELVRQAWEEHGVQALLLIDPLRITKTPAQVVEAVKRYHPGSVAGIEGPNEVNNKFPPQVLNQQYAGKIDEQAGAAYMDEVYAALKADPATHALPVIAFTGIFTDYSMARPHLGFDYGNMHSYQGDDVPSSSLLMNMTRWNNIYPPGATIRPIQPTEAGYNVEADRTNQQGWTGSIRAQARNIPMLLTEYYLHGIPRTYLFALHNADGYGLLEDDQKTKRPSYHILRNMIAELAEAKWDRAKKQWVKPTFTPRALLFTLENAPPTVHTLTLQRSDGRYQLLIWNEVRNFDRHTQRDLDPGPTSVTMRIARDMGAEAVVLKQNEQGGYDRATVRTTEAGRSLTISVEPMVTIVNLTPASTTPVQEGLPPEAPSGLQVQADEARVWLRWNQPRGSRLPEGFFVYRNGRHVATLPAGVTQLADDTPWIRPGLGYTYGVESFDAQGRPSARVEQVVVTADRRPDLVVEQPRLVGLDGEELQQVRAGDRVRFAALVRNIGQGRTPGDVPVSATFFVNGQFMAWQTVNQVLTPGQGLTLVSQGGGANGDGTWTVTSGMHLLAAMTDDINRIGGEADEGNNWADRSIQVGVESGGVLQGESQPAPGLVDVTNQGRLDWMVPGVGGKQGLQRKQNGRLISEVTTQGQGHVDATAGFAVRSVWRDGEPLKQHEGSHDGLWMNGVGHRFMFSAEADHQRERVLRIHVAGIEGARGRLIARLSDDSAPVFESATWNGNRGNGDWAAIPGGFTAVYTLRYRGGQPGAKLMVEWVLDHEPNAWRGQVRLGAITLSDQ